MSVWKDERGVLCVGLKVESTTPTSEVSSSDAEVEVKVSETEHRAEPKKGRVRKGK